MTVIPLKLNLEMGQIAFLHPHYTNVVSPVCLQVGHSRLKLKRGLAPTAAVIRVKGTRIPHDGAKIVGFEHFRRLCGAATWRY